LKRRVSMGERGSDRAWMDAGCPCA
jgi:hypothetical protein